MTRVTLTEDQRQCLLNCRFVLDIVHLCTALNFFQTIFLQLNDTSATVLNILDKVNTFYILLILSFASFVNVIAFESSISLNAQVSTKIRVLRKQSSNVGHKWILLHLIVLFTNTGLAAVGLIYFRYFVFINVDETLNDSLSLFRKDEKNRYLLNQLQREGKCCGSTSFKDWFDIQ